MRHQKNTVKLGRTAEHRKALLANQVCSLIEHSRIKTTLAKAKAVRPFAEKMLTLGKRGTLHDRRNAIAYLHNTGMVKKLFEEIAPRSAGRNGSYTRIIKLGPRQGDSAPMAYIEWVDHAPAIDETELKKAATRSVKKEAKQAAGKVPTAKKQTSTIHKAKPLDATVVIPDPATAVSYESEMAQQLIAAVAIDNPDVNALCSTYQLRREELGRLTGFSLRALADWATGKLPSVSAKRRLHEVRRLLDALAEIVEPVHIPHWLHQSDAAFDRLTPLQVIEIGEIDRLWAMVYDLSSGQPS